MLLNESLTSVVQGAIGGSQNFDASTVRPQAAFFGAVDDSGANSPAPRKEADRFTTVDSEFAESHSRTPATGGVISSPDSPQATNASVELIPRSAETSTSPLVSISLGQPEATVSLSSITVTREVTNSDPSWLPPPVTVAVVPPGIPIVYAGNFYTTIQPLPKIEFVQDAQTFAATPLAGFVFGMGVGVDSQPYYAGSGSFGVTGNGVLSTVAIHGIPDISGSCNSNPSLNRDLGGVQVRLKDFAPGVYVVDVVVGTYMHADTTSGGGLLPAPAGGNYTISQRPSSPALVLGAILADQPVVGGLTATRGD